MSEPRPIRWLHLSDLHCGGKGRELWEQVEEELHRDVDMLLARRGAPDLLLFTGDLAFSGKPEEYGEVDRILDRLLERLTRSGAREPTLLAVPGNHDVARPADRVSRLGYRILKDFDGTTDDAEVAEIHEALWSERDASFITPLFPGYSDWFGRRVRPGLEGRAHFSHFPCDFMAEVEPEGAFRLAILGLNSTWIQYTGGDFDGKLLLPFEQYRAAVAPPDANPAEVFERNAQALLLMHQPPDWLSPRGRAIFDESIYRPRHVTACLFGHLHEANGTLYQSAGGEPRVFLQSPSLFGLEQWGKSGEERAFGYSWGELAADGELRLWPRELRRRQDGVWSFGQDPRFHHDLDGGVLLRPGDGSALQVAVEQRGIDLARYLAHVIERTDTLEIRGIAGDRSQRAICPPIENLYTPLRMRSFAGLGEDEPGELLRGESTVALQTVLSRGDRILIEGEPGAGKTTFLRLVACMQARDAAGLACPGAESWRQAHLGLATGEPAIPVLLRLAGMVPLLAGDHGPDDRSRLLDLLETELEAADLAAAFDRDYWRRLLKDGKAWLLLDGLDEVDDLDLRRRLFAIVGDAAARWRAPMVVASRPFQTEAMAELGFRVATVEPFRPQEIETFLAYWAAALYRQDPALAIRGKAERYRERLEEAILTRPKVRELARNPVMLTCLCVVHWNRGDLPDVRSRVYAAVIRWLLDARADLRRERFGLEPDFAERALATLALHGMSTDRGKQSLLALDDAAAVVEPAFERALPETPPAARGELARQWLLFECEGSGVVEEVAGGRLRFWHLTFQEFLAALELARMERQQWWAILSRHLERAAWRETSELFGTCLYDLGRPQRIDWFLEQILERRQGSEDLGAEARTVGTIGRLLLPLKRCGYQPSGELQRDYDETLERIEAIFTREGAALVPVKDRITAAEALGQGGDPRLRPEAMEESLLPVPGELWRLAKYPVTVEEYQRFVDSRGYEVPAWWSSAGWAGKQEQGWSGPGSWDGQLETPNRPVVDVSWWEAEAYCLWLSDLRGKEIRLPTQAEWERAATHPDGEYPWGAEEPDEDLANFGQKVGRPTPVGIYPRGDGAHGHCDFGGNVWEWCLGEADDGKARPLRGGSWWHAATGLRSAIRLGHRPVNRYDLIGFRVLCAPPSSDS
ncbi:MAG: SUMF1/EgtB/PvdO family nonheme iron enzyme [Thermoanaerobaculia bacterium]